MADLASDKLEPPSMGGHTVDKVLEAAKERAKKLGKRVEVPSRFSENMKVWANEDGKTLHAELRTSPIHLEVESKDGKKTWKAIDTTIVQQADGSYSAKFVKTPLKFGGENSKTVVTASGAEGKAVVGWGKKLPKPTVDGNKIIYRDAVAAGADLVVTALPDGFTQEVVLRERPKAPLTINMPVTPPKGMTYGTAADGSTPQLKSAQGPAKSAPLTVQAVDAVAAESFDAGRTARVPVAVQKTALGTSLVLRTDQTFLSRADVTYPVTLSMNGTYVGAGLAGDTFVAKNTPSTNYSNGYLRVGTTSTSADIARVYAKFTVNGTDLDYATIHNADYMLWNYRSGGAGTAGTNCGEIGSGIVTRRVTSQMNISTMTWGSGQPSYTTTGQVGVKYGYSDTAGCPGPGELVYSIESIVQEWANGTPDDGLVMMAPSESAVLNWRQYRSQETGTHDREMPDHEPILFVEYEPAPTKTEGIFMPYQDTEPTEQEIAAYTFTSQTMPEPPAVTDQEALGLRENATGYALEDSSVGFNVPDDMTREEWLESIEAVHPPVITALDVSPASVVDGVKVTSSLTPELQVWAQDPAGGTLRVEYEIEHDPAAPAQGSGQIWSGAVDDVASGQPAKVPVEAGKLSDGWQTRWRARAVAGGSHASPWSEWQSLKVDIPKPSSSVSGMTFGDHSDNGYVLFTGADGSQLTYTRQADGTYKRDSDPTDASKVVKDSPIQFTHTAADGVKTVLTAVSVPATAPARLFADTATPAVAAVDESASVELGVAFTADKPGLITGVRFYKGPGNTGTHIGNLWTTSGQNLATGTFTDETESGWQTLTFSAPVQVVPGVTYVASYFAPAGHYSFSDNFFSTATDSPPLHAPATTETYGGNGVYAYGTSSLMPSGSYHGGNYWVDVEFVPNQGQPDPALSTVSATHLFGAAATPGTAASTDLGSLELGVKFTADKPGFITGVRFYKGPGNTGAHVGNLWTASGQNLATGTFTGESESGWQTLTFTAPVQVTSGTTYVVSYFAPVGHYAFDANYFATATNSPPLHAPATTGVYGGNGVYTYSAASQFPTSTYGGGNYWVDVNFASNLTRWVISSIQPGDEPLAQTDGPVIRTDKSFKPQTSTLRTTAAVAAAKKFPYYHLEHDDCRGMITSNHTKEIAYSGSFSFCYELMIGENVKEQNRLGVWVIKGSWRARMTMVFRTYVGKAKGNTTARDSGIAGLNSRQITASIKMDRFSPGGSLISDWRTRHAQVGLGLSGQGCQSSHPNGREDTAGSWHDGTGFGMTINGYWAGIPYQDLRSFCRVLPWIKYTDNVDLTESFHHLDPDNSPQTFRCDSSPKITSYTGGCVVWSMRPVFVLDQNDSKVDESASHILKALYDSQKTVPVPSPGVSKTVPGLFNPSNKGCSGVPKAASGGLRTTPRVG
ncbi:DUF4082 domain-containing protein [Microbispora sp. NBC_01189]|uniref:DUF4082 domain-containing protein n=1 Tax=Microbispora sp. NBC_01189 TaxID=2903583 RepID=UPI002E12AC84|nr:DUF4082 domain-containing protein [Microbispora sp. NBC_01189]